MFHPVPVYVGLRYVVSRRRGFFVSFISWISMLGICVGVLALITIISVMNGLERETAHAAAEPDFARDARRRAGAHARLADAGRSASAVQPGVVGVAPYLDLQGMIGRGDDMRAAMIRGIEPQLEQQVSEIGTHMKAGTLDDLRPGERHIVLGAGLAYALDARIGDEITVLVPVASREGEGAIAGIDVQPRIQTFTVSGVFEVGAAEHDNVLAFVHLQDAAAIAGNGGVPGGLRLKFADIFAAPARVQRDRRGARSADRRRATGRSRTPASSAPSASRRP